MIRYRREASDRYRDTPLSKVHRFGVKKKRVQNTRAIKWLKYDGHARCVSPCKAIAPVIIYGFARMRANTRA